MGIIGSLLMMVVTGVLLGIGIGYGMNLKLFRRGA